MSFLEKATKPIEHVCILLVIFYVLFQMNWFHKIGIENTGLVYLKIAVLAAGFGIFSIYGTLSGLPVGEAIANTRDVAAMAAGLLGGPIAGIGAGLLGGIVCSVRKGELPSPLLAAGNSAGMEVFHMLLVLLLGKSFSESLDLVKILSLPMIGAQCHN